jgi:hypothetical protein
MSRSGQISELSLVRRIIGRDIKWKLNYSLARFSEVTYISRTCAFLANHYSVSCSSFLKQVSSHDGMEPDQRPSIDLEGSWYSIQRDLNIHLTLAELDGGAESSPERAFLDDSDLTEFEVSLFLKVELIDIPCAICQLCGCENSWVHTPSNWDGLP